MYTSFGIALAIAISVAAFLSTRGKKQTQSAPAPEPKNEYDGPWVINPYTGNRVPGWTFTGQER